MLVVIYTCVLWKGKYQWFTVTRNEHIVEMIKIRLLVNLDFIKVNFCNWFKLLLLIWITRAEAVYYKSFLIRCVIYLRRDEIVIIIIYTGG